MEDGLPLNRLRMQLYPLYFTYHYERTGIVRFAISHVFWTQTNAAR